VAIQSKRNATINEITARATDNAEKMDITNQLPEKRKKRVRRLSEQAKDEGIDITPP